MKAAAVFYEVALRRLDNQLEQIDGLDGKIGATFGLATGVFPLFAAAISFRQESLPWHAWVLLGLGLLLYAGVVSACYRALQVAEFDLRPHLPTLRMHSGKYDEAAMRWWVANECAESFKDNELLVEKKTANLERAILLLPLEIAFFVGATLATLA